MMLVAFIAQQFACCCGESALRTRTHDHPTNVRQSCVYTYKHTHPHGDHHHHHHHHKPFDHHHESGLNTDKTDDENGSGERSHQHHVCIGTQTMYVLASRVELPKQDVSLGCQLAWVDFWNQSAMAVRLGLIRNGVDFGPPLSSCPQRSALCVYRI